MKILLAETIQKLSYKSVSGFFKMFLMERSFWFYFFAPMIKLLKMYRYEILALNSQLRDRQIYVLVFFAVSICFYIRFKNRYFDGNFICWLKGVYLISWKLLLCADSQVGPFLFITSTKTLLNSEYKVVYSEI